MNTKTTEVLVLIYLHGGGCCPVRMSRADGEALVQDWTRWRQSTQDPSAPAPAKFSQWPVMAGREWGILTDQIVAMLCQPVSKSAMDRLVEVQERLLNDGETWRGGADHD